jgi:hypothetical protein
MCAQIPEKSGTAAAPVCAPAGDIITEPDMSDHDITETAVASNGKFTRRKFIPASEMVRLRPHGDDAATLARERILA